MFSLTFLELMLGDCRQPCTNYGLFFFTFPFFSVKLTNELVRVTSVKYTPSSFQCMVLRGSRTRDVRKESDLKGFISK